MGVKGRAVISAGIWLAIIWGLAWVSEMIGWTLLSRGQWWSFPWFLTMLCLVIASYVLLMAWIFRGEK